jgi:hypothetical protein
MPFNKTAAIHAHTITDSGFLFKKLQGMKECRVKRNAHRQICACVFVHICTQTYVANTKKTFGIQQLELKYAAHTLNTLRTGDANLRFCVTTVKDG